LTEYYITVFFVYNCHIFSNPLQQFVIFEIELVE